MLSSLGSFSRKKRIQTVILDHKQYAIHVEGEGPFACLAIGTLLQNTLSKRFKETFTVYASNLYWHEDDKLDHPEALTIEKISLDLQSVANQLGLTKYIILGHSCYGIIALEVAKQDPIVQGVMLIASCPAWNDETHQFTKDYFEKHADAGRKANDAKRRAIYERIKKPTDSELSLNVYTRDSAKYWANYEVDDNTIHAVWQGFVPDDALANHFFCELLPRHQLENGLEKVKCPVLLLGGPFDFDSAPLELWKNHRATKVLVDNLTIIQCPQSGHWPNIENADLFDQKTKEWAENKL
ncbi:MAG: alpha/beta hydrolase [Alphaproteobacteria bacterium]|jgi:pimeloyl-ACP methyl ester carboxylesterase|nr:alpha/beta hydrolase [Alphaproteobacteria bacterium]MBP7729834.1 alpha/beta hydrolase [Alphaproteobacteria bacterium]